MTNFGIGQRNVVMSHFRSFAQRVSELVGSPAAFVSGVIITIVWASTGPLFIIRTHGNW